jgi:hypothetical protein
VDIRQTLRTVKVSRAKITKYLLFWEREYYIILYLLYCIVLYYIVLYYIVLYCIIFIILYLLYYINYIILDYINYIILYYVFISVQQYQQNALFAFNLLQLIASTCFEHLSSHDQEELYIQQLVYFVSIMLAGR